MEISKKQREFLELMEDPSLTELLIGGSAGGPLVFGSKVQTPFGEKNIEDIKIGDQVCNVNGGVSRVIDIPYEGVDDCYELEFSDGAKVQCSQNHLWKYKVARKRRRKHLSEFTLGTTDYIIEKMRDHHILIPLCEPVKFTRPFSGKMMDPYLLGVILGDGCTRWNKITITSCDEEIIKRCESGTDGYFVKRGIEYTLYNASKERKALKSYGLWGLKSQDKFIPDMYKYGSVETRIAIIQGLIDTDGTVDKRGHLSFASTSERLAKDAQFILRSLGARATITRNEAGYKKDGVYIKCNDVYDVYIQHKHKEWFVGLSRKKKRIRPFNGGYDPCRRLVRATYVGRKKVRCISVSELDGLFLTNDFIVTHNSKSYCIGLIIAIWAKKYPGTRFFVGRKTLKSLKQSTINTMLNKVFPALGVSYDEYRMHFQEMTLEFSNGSLVIFGELDYAPSDPEFARLGSLEIDIGIVDEAGEITRPAKDVLRARTGRGVMAQKYGFPGKLLLASNPQTNFLFNEYYEPFEKLGGGGFQKWQIGEVTINEGTENEKTVPSYRGFLRMGAYDNPFLPQSYIDNLKSLPDVQRKRLLEGNWRYADEDNMLFKAGLLDKATVYELPELSEKFSSYIGVDVSAQGGDKTVYTLIKNGVVITQKLSSIQANWDKKNEKPLFRLMADELIEFAQKNGFTSKDAKCIAVEGNGVGQALVTTLKERGWYIREYTATHKSRGENFNQLQLDLDSGAVKLYHEMNGLDDLRKELSAHTFELNNQDIVVEKKEKIKMRIGHSPDRADSLQIAVWCLHQNTDKLDDRHNQHRIVF